MMFSNVGRAAIFAALLGSSVTNAFWILSHSSLTQDRLDPVVSAGKVSSHVHTVVGAQNFKPVLTTSDMQASSCTTSPVQADMSNYWAPQLYHHNLENNTYTLIPISFVNTYYLNRDGPTQKTIKAFPAGLRMIAGDATRTTYNGSDLTNLAVSYVCLDYQNGSSGNLNSFPPTNCKDGMRAQIVFPSCWDGVNLDSEDHKSHMSYPVGGAPDSGDCPSSHPVKVMTLFNEWVFDVGSFSFTSGQKNWVFATGDEVGYSFHADFVNGWDQSVLEAAVDQCTGNLFGNVEQCPPFVASINRTKAGACKTPSIVEENIIGPLTALPGCNPIPLTPGATCTGLSTPAIKGFSAGSSPTGTVNTSVPVSSGTSVASTVASSKAPSSAVPSSAVLSSASPTSDAPPSASTSKGSSFKSGSSGHCKAARKRSTRPSSAAIKKHRARLMGRSQGFERVSL